MTPTAESAQLRREKNQASARQSRQRRVAYTLQLELSLRNATELIRSLETEILRLRAESLLTDGCMLSQALLDPTQMGFYRD